MGTRIDDLEKNVLELMSQAGMEEQATPKWQEGSRVANWRSCDQKGLKNTHDSHNKVLFAMTWSSHTYFLTLFCLVEIDCKWNCFLFACSPRGWFSAPHTLNKPIKCFFFYLIQLFQRLLSPQCTRSAPVCQSVHSSHCGATVPRVAWH